MSHMCDTQRARAGILQRRIGVCDVATRFFGGHVAQYRIIDGSVEGYATKTLIRPDDGLRATFAPGAGMVGCSFTHRGVELLAARAGLARYATSGSTMGIPLLHPWANRLASLEYTVAGRTVTLTPRSPLLHFDSSGMPMHGLQPGNLRWQLTQAEASGSAARPGAANTGGNQTTWALPRRQSAVAWWQS